MFHKWGDLVLITGISGYKSLRAYINLSKPMSEAPR